MIAGTAAAAGLTVATRNRAEFRNCGLSLVDPWSGANPPPREPS
jgi:predicted nucleic acid-binding protein